MTTLEAPDPDDPMTDEQAQELRGLAEQAGEEIPAGMRAAEAAQRIEELRAQTGG